MPWRIEHEFDVSSGDTGEIQQGTLRAAADAFAHRTTSGGQGHGDAHARASDLHVVDQAEVHDVHADLGVEHLAQGIQHDSFGQWIGIHAVMGLATGNGLICGLRKCANTLAVFQPNNRRLANKHAPPARTVGSLSSRIATEITIRPTRYAKSPPACARSETI